MHTFEVLETFENIPVNYGLNWKQMVAAGNFDEIQKRTPKKQRRITAKPAPFPVFAIPEGLTGIVHKNMALIRPHFDITIFDLDIACRKASKLLSSAEDGLAFAVAQPAKQLKADITVAGTPWFNGVSDYANYVYLTSTENGDRKLATTVDSGGCWLKRAIFLVTDI